MQPKERKKLDEKIKKQKKLRERWRSNVEFTIPCVFFFLNNVEFPTDSTH